MEKQTPRYESLRVSREEYLDLEDDGFRYDMIDGVLYMSPSPNFEHANYAGNFYLIVGNYLKKQKIGKVVMEMDVLLPDGGDVVRPDISVLLSENLGNKKFNAPPMFSDSRSGVIALASITSSTKIAGNASNSKERVGLSSQATGKRSPFTKTEVQSTGVPRMETMLLSPFERNKLMLGRR